MIAPFDVFQIEMDGGVMWQGTAASLEEAKSRVQELASNSPGDYMILSHQTGNKIVLRAGGGAAPLGTKTASA